MCYERADGVVRMGKIGGLTECSIHRSLDSDYTAVELPEEDRDKVLFDDDRMTCMSDSGFAVWIK